MKEIPPKKLESKRSIPQYDPEKVHEISSDTIEKAFTSPKFEANLRKTVDMVLRHHREIGFLTIKEKAGDKFHYSIPIGGSEDNSTSLDEGLLEMNQILEEKGLHEEDWVLLGSIHFHGYEPRAKSLPILIPSRADISITLNYGGLFEIPQVQMIANMISKTEVKALVFQEPTTYSLLQKPAMQEELAVEIYELFIQNKSQEEVIQSLRHYGFKAGLVSFENGKLAKENIDFIRSFGTSAKPSSQSK